MSNQWLRLWHDMPTDPKWRTIARVSKQPISLVISVYVTLLCSASQNVTRGHADVTIEDIASQLDVTDQEIQSIFDAMQGRVLDGFHLTGWEKRQPKREDLGSEKGAKSAAERKRTQRERERALDIIVSHEMSRNVTTDKDKEEDTDTDIKTSYVETETVSGDVSAEKIVSIETKRKPVPPYQEIVSVYHETLPTLAQVYKLTETRKVHIKSLWTDELDDIESWRNYFKHIGRSDFLMGRSKPGADGRVFLADFDFIIKPANFVKIAEEKYHGKKVQR